jgi:hypothetical protein
MNEVKNRKQRLEEVTDELCGYKWYGNEEDEDYKKEYSMEYSHLLKEKEELEELIWKTKTLVFNGTSYQFSPYYGEYLFVGKSFNPQNLPIGTNGNGEEHYGIYINGELEPTYQLHPYLSKKYGRKRGVRYWLCSRFGKGNYTLNTISFGEELSFQNITECIEKIEKFTNTQLKS